MISNLLDWQNTFGEIRSRVECSKIYSEVLQEAKEVVTAYKGSEEYKISPCLFKNKAVQRGVVDLHMKGFELCPF